MALDITVGKLLGSVMTLAPIEGGGWSGGSPGELWMELWELVRDGDGYTGGYGRVSIPGHPFDNMKVVFHVRSHGTWNFDTEPGDFNVWIYPSLPSEWRKLATRFIPGELPAGHVAFGHAVIKLRSRRTAATGAVASAFPR